RSALPRGDRRLPRPGTRGDGPLCPQRRRAHTLPPRMTRVAWLSDELPPDWFPPVDEALQEPQGLLAVGGDLSPQRLAAAYARGIFPWYGEGEPVLWWSPDPREVLVPAEFHRSRSLRSEEHTSELQSRENLVCRLLLEKK